MDVAAWEPVYRAIAADLGYDRDADVRARRLADRHLRPFAVDRLDLSDARVAVVVGADLDAEGIRRARRADDVVATGDALTRLEAAGRPPRLVVTDLDSDPPRSCARTRCGRVVAVHAHGDNRRALRRWLPRMRPSAVLGTTQVHPGPATINAGGFTDGDRAAYLADHLGATELDLVGWDLGDRSVSPEKRRKLDWAARLLTHLEATRGERYGALDGHRAPLRVS